jgi:hypothetical protein
MDSRYLSNSGESHPDLNIGLIYVHFDFLNYKGIYIGDITDKNVCLNIMLPN